MGERQILEIARALSEGVPIGGIRNVKGTCYIAGQDTLPESFIELPSWDDVTKSKELFAEAYRLSSLEQDPIRGRTVVQRHGAKALVQLPPAFPLSEEEVDAVYGLPYKRTWHPMYDAAGGGARPCRSTVQREQPSGMFRKLFLLCHPRPSRTYYTGPKPRLDFAGDPDPDAPSGLQRLYSRCGGPTANFRHPSCSHQMTRGACRGRECLFPNPCRSLDTSQADYLELLRKCRAVPGVKKVFVRSGLRYDYLLLGGGGRPGVPGGAVRTSRQRAAQGGAGACFSNGPEVYEKG